MKLGLANTSDFHKDGSGMVIFVKKDKDVPSLGRIGSFLDKQRLGCTNNLSKKFKFLFLRKIVAEGGLSINLSFQHRGNH